jgi:SP family myo-inositol transporter-like MFS transporter 13
MSGQNNDAVSYLPTSTNTDGAVNNRDASSPLAMSDSKDLGSDKKGASASDDNFATRSVSSGFDQHAAEVLYEAAIEAAGQSTGASLYVWGLTGISAISGMLFGYDTGAINTVLVQTGTDIGGALLTSGEKELITSALSVGAIFGAIFAGYLSDRLGRKRTLVFCDFVFVIGAVIQASISSKWPFAVGRLVMGLGVGAASMIAPVFISEVSPVGCRGKLVTLNVVAITFGQVIATAIGAGFDGVPAGWRWIIAIGAFPPIFQGIIIEVFFPESPRHLQKIGKTQQASEVLAKMYPRATADQITAKMQVLQHHIAIDTQSLYSKYKDLLMVPQLRRASFLAALLQCQQQLTGFNALMYFSATIFSAVGLNNSTATSLVVSGVNFIVTCIAVQYLDRFGRRAFLKVTIPIMIFGLLFSTVIFQYLTAPTNHSLVDGYEGYNKALSGVLILGMVIFVAGYAGGLGHVPWSAGDFFRQSHRGVGASVGALSNWSFNLVVSSTFLRLMDAIKPAPTFGFYAALSFALAIITYFCYPETLSLSLEQAQSTLEGGFKVKESEKLRKRNFDMLRKEERDAKAARKSEIA